MKKHQFNENSHATATVSYLLPSLSLPPPPLPPKNYLFINTRSQIDKLYLKQKVSTESVSTIFFHLPDSRIWQKHKCLEKYI